MKAEKKILCYVIDRKELYLDQTFIELDYPLLYTCTDKNKGKYLCLCIDADDGEYLVAKTTSGQIRNLVTGKIPIRLAFRRSKKLTKVLSISNNAYEDICQPVRYEDLSGDELPKEGLCLIDNDEIISNRGT